MEKEYYTEVEALEEIKGFIIDNYELYSKTNLQQVRHYYEDLHHNVFNFGYRGGLEALEEYGVFKAIGAVQQYEMGHFGEVYTDLSDPNSVSDMLWYIIGEDVIYSLDTWGNCAGLMNEEDDNKIIKEIDERLDSLS